MSEHRSRRVDGAKLLGAFARSRRTPRQLEPLLESLGEGPLGHAMLLHPLDDDDFDPERLEGSAEIASHRLQALYDGAAPTATELDAWRAAVRAEILREGEGGPWNPAMLWRLVADDGVTLWAVVLGEDGGSWADVFGPFLAPSAALADLRMRGEVLAVDWADD